MRFLLSLLVLFLAGWGAGATAFDTDSVPTCYPIAKLNDGKWSDGKIYRCGGCTFVVYTTASTSEIEVLHCDFDKDAWAE